MTGRPIYLAEIAAYDFDLAALTTLRFGSVGYNDPSAPGFYQPRIKTLPSFRRDLFAPGTTGGASSVSFGDLILANSDGALDGLRGYGLAGQAFTLLLGKEGDAYGDFASMIVGRVEQPIFDDVSTVRIRLLDRSQDLQQPIQSNTYAGDNILPAGLEGVDDLAGKTKPLAFGDVRNASVPMVNTYRQEDQASDGAVHSVPAVYDNGAPLDVGSDYSSQSDMETTAPSPADFRAWPAGGYIRRQNSAVGTITADILEGATAADRSAAQIAKRIVTRSGSGFVSGDIEAADVTALDSANVAALGLWLEPGNATTFAAALDQILGSVGAGWWIDRLNKFRMRRFEAPGTPVATFRKFARGNPGKASEFNILDHRFVSSRDPDKGVPTYKVGLSYKRNWTVQTGNVAATVGDITRQFLAAPTRSVPPAIDTSVQTGYPGAVVKQADTLIVGQADAINEAARLLDLYKVQRDFIEIDTWLTREAIEAVDLFDTVTAINDRFGYGAGRDMVVIGLGYNFDSNVLTLALWG